MKKINKLFEKMLQKKAEEIQNVLLDSCDRTQRDECQEPDMEKNVRIDALASIVSIPIAELMIKVEYLTDTVNELQTKIDTLSK